MLSGTALSAGVLAIVGLLQDDGGVVNDLADEAELFIVSGALAAHMVPIALVAWQNNQIQRDALAEANTLNSDLRESELAVAQSRRRVVEAADRERSRIERDLHDGAQQRLVAVGLRLRLLKSKTEDLGEIHGPVTEIETELGAAIDELRELAHGIYPPVLQTGGLVDALGAVARRSPVPVAIAAGPEIGRMDPGIETALYFTALEALANAGKHAPDSAARVTVQHIEESSGRLAVQLLVVDDGPGFVVDATTGDSNGLLNMRDRVTAVGGYLQLESAPGEGTTVTATVPI